MRNSLLAGVWVLALLVVFTASACGQTAEKALEKGNSYLKKQMYDEAIKAFDEAIKINPNSADVYYDRAVAYYGKKDYEKAWNDAIKSKELGGTYADAFLYTLKDVYPEGMKKLARLKNPEIINAAMDGDIAKIKELLKQGADVNTVNQHGQTPLMWAAGYGHNEIVGVLLDNGANIDAQDSKGATALQFCVMASKLEIAKMLISRKADVNIKDKLGKTPLMHAATAGNAEMMNILIQAKADLNVQDNQGMTALMWACLNAQKTAVEILLSKGADINKKSAAGLTAKDYSFHPEIKKIMEQKTR